MQRPDTCYLTHVYVKKELAFLTRRVEEVARYFLALEQIAGTGALGAVLERSLRELEARMENVGGLVDEDEVRALLEAGVRLGISPSRCRPLREQLEWLRTGRRREQLRTDLAASVGWRDPDSLRQLIDDAVRHGVAAEEVEVGRRRLREVEQAWLDERMLAAARRGDTQTAERHVWRGASREARDPESGATLWHIAAEGGNADVALLAERLGIDVNLADALGRTPLMAAASFGRRALAATLLRLGADVERQTPTAEHAVEVERGSSELEAALSACDAEGQLLRPACLGGATLDVGDRLLVSQQDTPLALCHRAAGRTALHFAVMRCGLEGVGVSMVQALLSRGADANAVDSRGRAPLWYAAHGGKVAEAQLLLRLGASVSATSRASPLIAAAQGFRLALQRGDREACSRQAEVLRLLRRAGGGRDLQELEEAAAAFGEGFEEACRGASSLEEALVLAGGSGGPEAQAFGLSLMQRYSGRLRRQRGRRLDSAGDAAAFAADAHGEFEALAFRLARETGCRAVVAGLPSASRLRRLARRRGLLGAEVEDSAVDWCRVTNAVQGRLIFPSAQAVYEALQSIEAQLSHRLRAVVDRLACLDRQPDEEDGAGSVELLIEAGGSICTLYLTVARVAEVVEVRLLAGDWLHRELGVAMARACAAEVAEALEFAREHMDVLRLMAVLNSAPGPGLAPPVCGAVQAGSPDILELLLNAGASANAQDASGVTALAFAAKSCDLRCFTLLLRSGADAAPDSLTFQPADAPADAARATEQEAPARESYGEGAADADGDADGEAEEVGELSLAESTQTQGSNSFAEEARRLLLEAHTQRGIDSSALAKLVEEFDGSARALAAAEQLLAAGAAASGRTASGPTGAPLPLLSCAAAHRSPALVRLLLARGAKVQEGVGSESALRLATGSPAESVLVSQALEELQAAVSASDLAAIFRLLAAGTDPEAKVATGDGTRTLLTYATELPVEQGLPLLEAVLDAGAAVDRRDPLGRTPLLHAVRRGAPIAVVNALVLRGADVCAVDAAGQAATMFAAARGDRACLERLLDAGALGSAQDHEGLDAAEHALRANQEDCLRLLQERGHCLSRAGALSAVFAACRAADAPRLAALLDVAGKEYPGLASCDEEGQEGAPRPTAPTLLMAAVLAGCADAARVLLARGALLHPRATFGDFEEVSAWMLAGEDEELRAALREALPHELLVSARSGAEAAVTDLQLDEDRGLVVGPEDLCLRGEDGYNALDHAVLLGFEGLECFIAERGGRLSAAAASSTRVLLEPTKCGNLEAVQRRLQAGADVNATDANGRTAVDWCLITGNLNGLVWRSVEKALSRAEAEGSLMQSDSLSPRSSIIASNFRRGSRGAMSAWSAGGLDFVKEDDGFAGSVASFELARIPKAEPSGQSIAPSMAGRSASGMSHRNSVSNAGRSRLTAVLGAPIEAPPDPRGAYGAVEAALVEAGGRLSTSIRSAWYCLHEPLERREFDIVRRRIAAGADCDVVNERGVGLPHLALDLGGPQLAALLVEAGASPNGRDRRGRTVLWRAVEQKQAELAVACLNRGADLSLGLGASNDGSLAHLALETGQPDIAIRVLAHPSRGCPPDKRDTHGRTVLFRALELKQSAVARACLDQGANATVTDHLTGRGLLHLALESRQPPDLVADLLEAGAAPVLGDRQGRTPLQLAASFGDSEALEHLIKAGAVPGPAGGPEAVLAAQCGHFRAVAVLVRAAGVPADRIDLRRLRFSTGGSSSAAQPLRSALAELAARLAKGGGGPPKASSSTLLGMAARAIGVGGDGAEAAKEAARVYLANQLEGAGIEASRAMRLAEQLSEWAGHGATPAEREARGEALEHLPSTVAAEGARAASVELAEGGLIPSAVVEELAIAATMARRPELRRGNTSAAQSRSPTARRASTVAALPNQ